MLRAGGVVSGVWDMVGDSWPRTGVPVGESRGDR